MGPDDPTDPLDESGFAEEGPSKPLSVAMIVVGILFLLPFILLSATGGPFFSLNAFISAVLSVGWTFGLGVVFLLFGWNRLRAGSESDDS